MVAAVLLTVGVIEGCGEPEGGTVSIGGIYAPPPADLAEVATFVRRAEGAVVVGHVVGTRSPVAPGRADATGDVWVEYPQEQANILVTDPLGSTMTGTVSVTASTGEVYLTDADGVRLDGTRWVIEDLEAFRSRPQFLPADETDHVFFLIFPREPTWIQYLYWVAAIEGGVVDGAQTTSGAAVPLDSLRL